MRIVYKSLFAAAALAVTAVSGTSASAATCLAMPETTYQDFVSCTVSGSNDSFAVVNNIVETKFGGTVSLTAEGTFSAASGGLTGAEFFGSRAADGFEISNLVGKSITFDALPDDTLFISIKKGNGFELFGLYGLTPSFTLTHSLNGNGFSHISTYAGELPPPSVPLPAAGLLLLGAIGGLAGVARRRASRG